VRIQEHKTKQPYYIHLDGDRVMRMAGLYDSWQDAEGNWLTTYTILTTDSSKRLQWCAHSRSHIIMCNTLKAIKTMHFLPCTASKRGKSCACRIHDRMPVILPDAQAEEAWLQNGVLDSKCATPFFFPKSTICRCYSKHLTISLDPVYQMDVYP
jgi:putative SOS response-associated peptidase YedK